MRRSMRTVRKRLERDGAWGGTAVGLVGVADSAGRFASKAGPAWPVAAALARHQWWRAALMAFEAVLELRHGLGMRRCAPGVADAGGLRRIGCGPPFRAT